MNFGNWPKVVPISKPADKGYISPALTLLCVGCGNDRWDHHVFHQEGFKPKQTRRCTDCRGKTGRWATEKEKDEINDARWKEEMEWLD